MTTLIEKVARAIASAYHDVNGCAPGTLNRTEALDAVNQFWPDYKPEARAAIAAVAEWLDDALKDDDGRIYVPQFLRNKLEQPK